MQTSPKIWKDCSPRSSQLFAAAKQNPTAYIIDLYRRRIMHCTASPDRKFQPLETADPRQDENSCRAAPDIIESHPSDGCGRHENAYVHEKQGLRHCIFTSPTTEPPSPTSVAPVPAGVLIPFPSPTELRRIPPSARRPALFPHTPMPERPDSHHGHSFCEGDATINNALWWISDPGVV